MILLHELFKPTDNPDDDARLHLAQLHYRLNFLRRLTDFPWVIDRGFSTPDEQIAIYEAKGLPPKMGSCHLLGAAADVADPKGELKLFLLDHLEVVESLNLFMESFEATPSWVHLQIFPYASWRPGKTHFFEP